MGGGPESRCVGCVYCLEGAVRRHLAASSWQYTLQHFIEFCRRESVKTLVKTFPHSIITAPFVLGLFRHFGFPIRKDVSQLVSLLCASLCENIEQFDITSSFWLPEKFCKFSPQKKKR